MPIPVMEKVLRVHCKVCNYGWIAAGVALPMTIDRFVAEMRREIQRGCPKCGAAGDNVMTGFPLDKIGD
jgi:hypothetical protein